MRPLGRFARRHQAGLAEAHARVGLDADEILAADAFQKLAIDCRIRHVADLFTAIVRLEIVISAKGNVDSISALGGNPVLVEAASNAVKKWKYQPADADTKTQVEFTFDPTHQQSTPEPSTASPSPSRPRLPRAA